ncbi:membrane protein [Methylopila jiangsuensis]|uniref:Membrane protein n=1 Tax=Methylopila jiangsuensis TaxID=586230 RepID=A0A9W6JGE5_9HYPH|nr:GlsB/YeaQ/YmgE family stress response membrane protein [Methylopila jiangsuensis]MDR6285796.1 putative membrane protein YeaQ/YmgE (transglycosylase-associated protein family) [Methylopila jiangsuensis]GLK75554.1 membrane protein [Methylopila jiangsuensis]
MEGVGWLMAIILGAIAGWIAEQIMKSDMGLIMNIILGIIGAVVMNAILRAVGVIPPGGWIWQCIVAIAGACLLIWGYRLVRGRG